MKVKSLIYICAYALLTACGSDDAPDNFEPRLYADEATDITRTEATVNGHVSVEGNTPMPELLFRYGTMAGMSQSVSVTPTDGYVSATLSNLTAGSVYFYCLEGSNGRVTLNSNTASFETNPNEKPTVSGLTKLSQGPMSVIVSYQITDDGGDALTETGCYVTDTEQGTTAKTISETIYGEGTYRLIISGLRQNTTYKLSAFATSKVGESQGETLTITTSNAVVLSEAGQLATLMGNALYDYDSIPISGSMNGDDFRCLRQMMGRDAENKTTAGKLSTVNLADAQIVAGGGSYGSSRYTSNDVVGYGMFAGCTNLTSIVLPVTAVTVERDAFADCSSLASITLPAAATSVSPSSGCNALTKICAEASMHYISIDGVLFNAAGTQLIWFPKGKRGDYTLPSTVTEIGDCAFQECSITHFTLPDGLTEIGQAVFLGCMAEEITLPNKLKTVPTATFQNCSRLKTVRLGESIELVSDYAFDGCPLRDVYVDATEPPMCHINTFKSSNAELFSSCTLHVPIGRMTIYRNNKNWGQFEKIVEQ